MQNILNHFKVIDQLDFRHNRAQLIWSYLYRICLAFIFGVSFNQFVNVIYGKISFESLVNIEIDHLPGIVSIILLIIDVVFVLYLHELIHAGIYFLTKNKKPEIGIRGLVIYAAAPEEVISRNEIIVNALAPFLLISILGAVLLSIVPQTTLAWIFIPTLVNAAASAGDFMLISFVLKQKRNARYNDIGDIIYALEMK